ncbi:unnamed protein product [Candida verbasci]|uniref:Amino acid permease/ SLC12A domain-containing protein n=1 Tax=Candida verbasci TaxID=1227364 RepID=A0A9W4XBW3_9ASCO|nr:unnamed protein product [Candida verbasci]
MISNSNSNNSKSNNISNSNSNNLKSNTIIKESNDEYSSSLSNNSAISNGKSANAWTNFKDSFKPPVKNNNNKDLEFYNDEGIRQDESAAPLKQNLKKRQLQMIALGGCVGSGLLVASGLALQNGPLALVIAWLIVGSFLYCTMQSLAELCSYLPVSGSFATYSARFIDSSWGFAMGWNYALFWVIVLPLELVASSMTINFWQSNINSVVWVAVFYVLIFLLNLCGNKGFGEFEFIASIIKLLGVVGFNILAIIIICGGTGNQGYIGGKNWHPPLQTGFKGIVSTCLTATYSLAGTELVGLTSSESEENPAKSFRSTIKQINYRILIFYLLTLTLVGFLVPATYSELAGSGSADTSSSPFVIAINAAQIKVLPSIFNVVVLVALLAISNSAVYGFSRTCIGLAEQGLAPSCFKYIDRKGRPLVGMGISAVFGLLSFVSASKYEDEVFAWLVAISGLSTLFTWGSINGAYIRFRGAMKYQNRSIDELPYKSTTGVIGAYYGLIMNIVVLALQFWLALYPIGKQPHAKDFFKTYLGAVIVLIFYVVHKLWTRNWKLCLDYKNIDLDSGKAPNIDLVRQEIEEEKELIKTKPFYYRVYRFLC